jgi:hypothetical protein
LPVKIYQNERWPFRLPGHRPWNPQIALDEILRRMTCSKEKQNVTIDELIILHHTPSTAQKTPPLSANPFYLHIVLQTIVLIFDRILRFCQDLSPFFYVK